MKRIVNIYDNYNDRELKKTPRNDIVEISDQLKYMFLITDLYRFYKTSVIY